MSVQAPVVGSLWHYPPWTNPAWSGPWRVIRIGHRTTHEWADRVVYLDRLDGAPEGETAPHEVALEDGIIQWPGGWEPWPAVPDFPPQ